MFVSVFVCFSIRPQLFKGKIVLSSGSITIHWRMQLVILISLIRCIMLYPVDSPPIYPLNNSGQKAIGNIVLPFIKHLHAIMFILECYKINPSKEVEGLKTSVQSTPLPLSLEKPLELVKTKGDLLCQMQ